MSHLLWKYYWDNDVDRFRRLLAPSSSSSQALSKSPVIGSHGGAHAGGSPGTFGTPPRPHTKSRRVSGQTSATPKLKDNNVTLSRSDVNSRDYAGLTVLLRAAASTNPNAQEFIKALIAHPGIDLHAQDPESGWNALHRSLYAGNVSIARLLLEKERADLIGRTVGSIGKVGQLIKTKDHENNSPFDVYNSTIATRALGSTRDQNHADSDSENGDRPADPTVPTAASNNRSSVDGDELFMFGSNKNLSLGVGDEDDRQYPERILLKRPDHLFHRFHQDYLGQQDLEVSASLPSLGDIPTLIHSRPLLIQDVVLSKLHSAVITNDPVSNLYISGVGRTGRLGLGDENTHFKFVPVQGPLAEKRIHQVALGQNHSMAVAGNGELWTWGLNSDSQLGYILPPPVRADEEPMSLTPRQVFGPLKKEIVLGIAASAIHSVAHTGLSLFCWGRNVGQLALMDADSRSLDVQQTPRKVAASLLSAPIVMVSAIDRATTCLLANHTVWVFTNYGYNLVKFPFPDVFTNHNLSTTSFSNRYDPGRREIAHVTSGGDTIAAVTARGDLFTMQLSGKGDLSQPAGSTTNPSKIKGAITQPQCIWTSRKDGVVSVSVGENGSVIICTESGAVWRRIKRVKGKAAAFGPSDHKRKDFKFQRVPYITNCVRVRSSTFGAFAAIRKDNKVMSEEIKINAQSLWDDVGTLLCLREFEASEPLPDEGARKRWDAAITRETPGSVSHQILRSPDIETDLLHWLQVNAFQYDDMDMAICASTAPEIKIPVHGWVLAARSSVLRSMLAEARIRGTVADADMVDIEMVNGKTTVMIQGVDILAVLNLVVYAYLDTVVPVWKYTREAPTLAHRYRQVRVDVMKMAAKLHMLKLEAAARMQVHADPSLDTDMEEAITDPAFFDDGNVIIQLDGAEVEAHSQLLCQRCPFFEGMFYGRSQGQWLASRRDALGDEEKLRIDMKHIRPDTFHYVLRYLYADTGEELFNDVVMSSIDDFSELVVDVMGAANELMLDRLSQICQSIIGKFVNTRNIANLLNEISPCSVTNFKDVGLEYICLQLESILENHLLDGLDEDLLHELDEVVRDNQLARFPFARSGRAEALLHEQHPDLAYDIEEERQRRVKELASKSNPRDEEKKLSSSFKTRFGSVDESLGMATTPDGTRRKSKGGRNEPFSPSLRAKASNADMIFNMDDEDVPPGMDSPLSPIAALGQLRVDLDMDNIPQLPKSWRESRSKVASSSRGSPLPNSAMATMSPPNDSGARGIGASELRTGAPWASSTLQTTKLDLKNIMTETSSKSALTARLAAAQKTSKEDTANKSQIKMTQKERKKQLQLQAEARAAAEAEQAKLVPWEPVTTAGRAAPWKASSSSSSNPPKTSLSEAMLLERAALHSASPTNMKPLVASEASPRSAARRTASPDTRFPGQGRTSSSPAIQQASSSQPQKKVIPHSKSYIKPAPKAEPILGESMADIIGQQRREQELVKEAVAKRSLQEIQQEQAFQEWWDQESKRAQEEESRRQNKGKDKEEQGARRGRHRPGKPKGNATNTDDATKSGGRPKATEAGTSSRGRGPRKRGTQAPS
ncbi:hypothetical protein S40288_04792 [Stachybotrys chartarum IBT 40288]|nr:hypothetical protein S40288_04792 [Stachybotrys chartarum IBT 40288]